ncbi:hypothetical protein ASPBRDRAFT_137297 [Aspergillus brasiliensis CBS 101740]|uniref:Uncharacterized protein n=1 Tax=Aspergillus brasiliensis (strain CBS 101740 / IMI 381727 / IBT 21946) TaxID=767769 RepID=A0A1L9U522_ASPBC|nr:hypothetical protein ASPBRDRAFT_137297 [Aspergillus brasiliensis CBS 101740]
MNLNFFSCFSFLFFICSNRVTLNSPSNLPDTLSSIPVLRVSLQCLFNSCEELHSRPSAQASPWWPPTDISDCLSIAPIRRLLPSPPLPLLPLLLLLPLNPPPTPPNTAVPTSKSFPSLPSSPWAPVPTSYL